jgi:spermidine synthase
LSRESISDAGSTLPLPFLYLVSVVEGAAVMAVELISARMIGVYFGNSLYVWAAVLAVTLLGLAAGYVLGGVLSSRLPDVSTLFAVVAISAALVLVMPFWGDWVMRQALGLEIRAASLLSATLFLFPPLLCFGTVSPLIVNLVSHRHGQAGRAAGTVFAVSTIGGIGMTLAVGFYLIPRFGLRTATLGVAAALAALPLGWLLFRRRFRAAVLMAVPMAIVLVGGWGDRRLKEQGRYWVRHLSDGLLGQVAVLETDRADTGERLRVLLINNVAQNLVQLPSFRSNWRYVHRVALYSSLQPAGSRVLVCGLGGGNLINELDRLDFEIDVVEIDPRMEALAREWFGMRGDATVHVDDARHFINRSRARYSVVVFDMASGDTQPINVYTLEAFREVRRLLEPDGMLFLHYQNRLSGEGAVAARSLGHTLERAGFHVRLVETHLDTNRVGEILFVAAPDRGTLDRLVASEFPRRDRFADRFSFPRGRAIFRDFSLTDGLLLTDDWPILEYYHLPTVDFMRGEDFRKQLERLLADRVRFL